MPRYKLTIAYDGTGFCGWQKQEPPAATDVDFAKVLGSARADAGGDPEEEAEFQARAGEGGDAPGRIVLRTVQEVVERAVREVVNEPVLVTGASRTDAGVHARGQVAAFTCSGDGGVEATRCGWPLSRGTDRLAQAINSRLPEDVLVVAAQPVHDAFDPISDCVAKGYSYTLHVSPDRPLFDRRYVHHVRAPLDAAAMRDAAARVVGEHDFAAFAKAGHGRESTVRTVLSCTVSEITGPGPSESATYSPSEPFLPPTDNAPPPFVAPPLRRSVAGAPRLVRIDVSGTGFLYNMVRIIAGTLVEVGRARLTPDDVAAAIASRDRRRAGPTLPPHGLCLEWVRYA